MTLKNQVCFFFLSFLFFSLLFFCFIFSQYLTCNIDGDTLSSPEYFRVLYNYLLRNESGVSINFWENDATMPILLQFCNVCTPALSLHYPHFNH